ncbi:uncharacterized protein LOC109946845 [Prunus persica]|uniref:uncharacterized protein LOC109946845 n=1 Tax=Prunus persica TaxID=3760 RepID=UPI0009AB9433|nr:uncharacterized protein LOC109946845 [Prunus persica]
MGKLTYFLGLQASYPTPGAIFVNQTKYARDLLHKAGMTICKPCPTPCKPHTQVLSTDGEPLKDPTLYRNIVGALQYLTFTRPDIAYSVNTVCQYMTNPTEVHFHTVKRILRYIQGTLTYVSWQSKRQGSVSRSSTEAEYRALAHTAADLAWIRQVLADLHMCLPTPPILYCDNLSALAFSSNPVFHSRIKHMDTDFHFMRERVQRKDLEVQYVPTEEQLADVFTKGLHSPIFLKHCTNLRLRNSVELEGG